MTCSKCEILITDKWNECIKKSDGMVHLFLYRKFIVRMPITGMNEWMNEWMIVYFIIVITKPAVKSICKIQNIFFAVY